MKAASVQITLVAVPVATFCNRNQKIYVLETAYLLLNVNFN